ncbi:MlaC/ttg2D family ABC transporter substrate-binding protein [Rhodopila sp.]|uniref:MlaC/ttg2D family ABC transporter substrate-binding protein n=1 Tax=Rhodopila sp. TaxID=2480087 RepID=UPI003D0FCD33
MIHRRHFMILAAASVALLPLTARADSTDKAAAFVKSTGDQLVAIVNGPGSAASKRSAMTEVLDSDVDVDGIGRFCLGRFWRQATPEQQKQYLALFHEVLVTNITSKLGDYKGVTFSIGRSRSQDQEAVVSTTVVRPNNPPTAVDWIIASPETKPKIIDVVAEGTSLRLTQRQDYASYLVHNNNNVGALIAAMKNQISRNG